MEIFIAVVWIIGIVAAGESFQDQDGKPDRVVQAIAVASTTVFCIFMLWWTT